MRNGESGCDMMCEGDCGCETVSRGCDMMWEDDCGSETVRVGVI
jgi:hypothetical protein